MTLALTSWAWIPVTIIIRFLVHLLFFDFDHPTNKNHWYNKADNPSLLFQNNRILPVPEMIFKFIFNGIIQFLLSIFSGLILHNVLAILFAVFACIQWFLLTLRDNIMIRVVSFLGRQPLTDSWIAWKIKGYGLGRGYSTSIELEDIKIFMIAELEKVLLNEYEQRINDKVQVPQIQATRAISTIFSSFNVTGYAP